jgi:hypothetical protein
MQHSGTDCGSRKSDDAREFIVANPHERMIKKVDVALYLCMVGISTKQGCRTGSSYPLSFRMRWK